MQTIIIMYYDEIIEKMIPGIYMAINNKIEEGYKDIFLYIKYYIQKFTKIEKKNIILKHLLLIMNQHYIMRLIKYLIKKKK